MNNNQDQDPTLPFTLNVMQDIINKRVAERAREIRRELNEEVPTQFTDAIKPVQVSPVKPAQLQPIDSFLNSPLPTDNEGRAYIRVFNPLTETTELVESLVSRFYMEMGFYPAVILLCPERWLFGECLEYFLTSDKTKIYYARGSDEWDVCCKSLPLQG